MDNKMLSIRSISSDRELIFSSYKERDRYHVKIKSSDVSASLDISQEAVGESLAAFFRRLASYRSPWLDSQEWQTYDQDLKITAKCTKRGHVLFRITLITGYIVGLDAEGWEANIGLETTLGELDNIARNASTFFQRTISET